MSTALKAQEGLIWGRAASLLMTLVLEKIEPVHNYNLKMVSMYKKRYIMV